MIEPRLPRSHTHTPLQKVHNYKYNDSTATVHNNAIVVHIIRRPRRWKYIGWISVNYSRNSRAIISLSHIKITDIYQFHVKLNIHDSWIAKIRVNFPQVRAVHTRFCRLFTHNIWVSSTWKVNCLPNRTSHDVITYIPRLQFFLRPIKNRWLWEGISSLKRWDFADFNEDNWI